MKTLEYTRQKMRELSAICAEFRLALEELAAANPDGINPINAFIGETVWDYIDEVDPLEITLLSGINARVIGLMPYVKGHLMQIRVFIPEEGQEIGITLGGIDPSDFVYIYYELIKKNESTKQ